MPRRVKRGHITAGSVPGEGNALVRLVVACSSRLRCLSRTVGLQEEAMSDPEWLG